MHLDNWPGTRAVSPVVGVVLLVAVTVVLVAVVGVSVFGASDQPQRDVEVQFSVAYDDGTVAITHRGGDSIESSRLTVTGTLGADSNVGRWHNLPAASPTDPNGEVSAGDSVTLGLGGPDVPASYELRVVYSRADSSVVVARDSGPAA